MLKILWRQVRFLTKSNLKSRYRSTIAGFLWVVINPVVLFGVQSFLFKIVLKMHVTNYSVFLLSGLLPWVFFSQSITMCTGILVASGRLLKSFPVHALVYIMAQLLDNLVNFLAAFILIGLPIGIFSNHWSLTFLLLPIPVIILFVGVTGMSFSLAVIHVFFRDTLFIITFLIQVLFFVTPVFFPPEYIPAQYRWVVQMNLIYYLIRPFRTLLYEFDTQVFLWQSFTGALVAAVLLGMSALIWKRSRNAIYFNI